MTSQEFRDESKKKPNKYRNKPVIVDGIRFASKLEAKRYGELKMLERAGKITFQMQVAYDLDINNVHITRYVADFVVYWIETGVTVVEDTKGVETPEYKIKRALMLALPGIRIKEIRK